MQWEITDKIFLGETLDPYDDARRSTAIDSTASNFDDAKDKVQKIRDLIWTGRYDENLAQYIPGMLELAFQGMLEGPDTKEKSSHLSYVDKEQVDFQILLTEIIMLTLTVFISVFQYKLRKKQMLLLILIIT